MQLIIPPLPEPAAPFYLHSDFWLMVANVALALVTAFLAEETWRMRRDSARGTESMRKLAHLSATASSMSAAATRALVEIGQRPWVSLDELSLRSEIAPDHAIVSFRAVLFNSGATPAMQVVAEHYYLVCSGSFPDLPDYRHQPDAPPLPITLCTRERRAVDVEIVMDPRDSAAVLESKAQLFVYGRIRYRDAFGNSHKTKWCAQYDQSSSGDGVFLFAGQHNSMEDS